MRNSGDVQWWLFWVVDAVEQANAQSALDAPSLTVAIGLLFAISILGLVTSLVATTRARGNPA